MLPIVATAATAFQPVGFKLAPEERPNIPLFLLYHYVNQPRQASSCLFWVTRVVYGARDDCLLFVVRVVVVVVLSSMWSKWASKKE